MCDCTVIQPKHRPTLAEWSEKTGILPTHPTTEKGAVSVLVDIIDQRRERTQLFHLEDYFVSSAGGLVVWLVPRSR